MFALQDLEKHKQLTLVKELIQREQKKREDNNAVALIDSNGDVIELDLHGVQLTQGEVHAIRSLNKLKKLNLSETNLSDELFGDNYELRSLVELDLSDTQIGDKMLSHLGGFRQLKHANLDRTRISNAGFAHLEQYVETYNLKHLDHLSIRGNRLADACLESLSKISDLKSLDISGTEVTNAGLKHLAELKNLKTVTAKATGMSMEGFRTLSEIPAFDVLKTLQLKFD